MTIDAVQKALLKLVGDQGSVSVSLHRHAANHPDHRYESESWVGWLSVDLGDGEERLRTEPQEARSGELLIPKVKAALRAAIHQRAFARKQQALEAPRRRIAQVLCLEHRP